MTGFANIELRRRRGVIVDRDLKRQAIKLQIVDGKIFALRQLSLLPGLR